MTAPLPISPHPFNILFNGTLLILIDKINKQFFMFEDILASRFPKNHVRILHSIKLISEGSKQAIAISLNIP
jgi:hypothetical protein